MRRQVSFLLVKTACASEPQRGRGGRVKGVIDVVVVVVVVGSGGGCCCHSDPRCLHTLDIETAVCDHACRFD